MWRAIIVGFALVNVVSGQETTIGPVKVKFAGFVDRLQYDDMNAKRYTGQPALVVTTDEYIAVKLQLENTEPTKLVRFHGWSFDGKNKDICAWATDEHGNRYKVRTFGRDREKPIIDMIEKVTPLEVGKPVFDTLVFEKPIKAATKLIIELPALSLEQGDEKKQITVDLQKQPAAAK